jgi:hypothetical protein
MRAADAIVDDIEARHAERLGAKNYRRFKELFRDIAEHQGGRSPQD